MNELIERDSPEWDKDGVAAPPKCRTAAEELSALASACHNGACNPIAIIHDLSEGIRGMYQDEVRQSIEVKIILGQLSYLLDESLGPSFETLEAYRNKTL